jgi:hypothetical protein
MFSVDSINLEAAMLGKNYIYIVIYHFSYSKFTHANLSLKHFEPMRLNGYFEPLASSKNL